MPKIDPINGPPDHYSGPSAGLSTEKGDSWHTSVKKINDGFAAVKHFIEHDVEAIDAGARKEIADLRETVATLQQQVDAMTTAGKQTPAVASTIVSATGTAAGEGGA